MTRFRPKDARELAELVAGAGAKGEALEVIAGGTKRGLGRPVETPHQLDVTAFAGIRSYEPEELVLTAGPATPMAEIARTLAAAQQVLPFEPGDWGPVYGAPAGRQTLGGVLVCNIAGPRRPRQGSARDHLLGFHAVSGRGEVFKSGGRVINNVTGYDLSKLMCGSFGTLAVLTEVTVKVLPAPEATRTLVLRGLDDARAVQAMTRALNGAQDVSGAAHLPAEFGARTLLRLEGPAPSVEARAEALRRELTEFAVAEVLSDAAAMAPWRDLADLNAFAAEPSRALWRVSVAPQAGPAIAAAARKLEGRYLYDWGGGLLWIAVADARDSGAAVLRGALGEAGGHATLIRASESQRAEIPIFEPQPPALAALGQRVKESFDPARILNPGRMYREL